MMSTAAALPEIISEAQLPGPATGPSRLFEALGKFEDLQANVYNPAISEELFHAFIGEYGYFPRKLGAQPLDTTTRQRWAELFRWFIAEMNKWQPADDPKCHTLVAVMIVSQILDAEKSLWDAMPTNCVPTQALIDCYKMLIRSCSISFAARPGTTVEPISEREAIDQFQIDDAEGNWAKICDGIRLFERSLYNVSFGLTQPVRCLYRCGTSHLVDAISGVRQTLVAVQIASVLARDKILRLAAASTNSYIEFGLVYQALAGEPRATTLSPAEQSDLTDVLLKVAQDLPRWTSWMLAFNTYPSRRSALQEPLGTALARTSEAAFPAYVDALWLVNQPLGQDLGRKDVAHCLSAFRSAAPLDHRKRMWKLAHERWRSWDFGKGSSQNHMFQINWSQLDYAVAAFASECLDKSQLDQKMNDIRAEMQTFDREWFQTKSDVTTAWNRLLSRFQPFAHASRVSAGSADWLFEKHTYAPFNPADNEYTTMMFSA